MTTASQANVALVGGPPWGFRVTGGNSAPVYITQVLPQSHAFNEGLQAGDQVLSIAGRPVDALSEGEIQRAIKKASGILRLNIVRSSSLSCSPRPGYRRGRPGSSASDIPRSTDSCASPAYSGVVALQPRSTASSVSSMSMHSAAGLNYLSTLPSLNINEDSSTMQAPVYSRIDTPRSRYSSGRTSITGTPVPSLSTAPTSPAPWNTGIYATSSVSNGKQWAPVRFASKHGDAPLPTNHYGYYPQLSARQSASYASCPATPLGPLSPTPVDNAREARMINISTTSVNTDTSDTSTGHAKPQELAITAASHKRVAYRTTGRQFLSLQSVTEGQAMRSFDEPRAALVVGGEVSDMSVRGPTFKATAAGPARWQPGHPTPVSSYSATKPELYSAPAGPVPFTPGPAPFTPSPATFTPSPAPFTPNRAVEAPSFAAKPAGLAIPPPPPAPAPGVVKPAHSVHAPANQPEPVLSPAERSIIEYPEKESVSSLRSRIESKLNGSIPVKGTPLEENLPAMPSAVPHTPVTSQPKPILPAPKPPSMPASAQIPAPPPPVAERKPLAPAQISAPPVADYNSRPMSYASSGHQQQQQQQQQQHAETNDHTYQPPPRPPLPLESISGTSYASVPGAAHHSSFDHRDRESVPVVRTERSPPRGATLLHRTTDHRGDKLHSESYYAVPYQETMAQKDFRHERIGPSEQGAPTGHHPHPHGDPGDYQHHWYKMMYKRLHKINRPEEQHVNYHVPDYWNQHFVDDPVRHREPNPYTVAYRYPDNYMSEPEIEDRPYFPKPYTATLPGRRSGGEEFGRSTRSKSAGRYEIHSPLPSDVIKSTPAGEKYRLQPRKIEDYVPGQSTLAAYETPEQHDTLDAASTAPAGGTNDATPTTSTPIRGAPWRSRSSSHVPQTMTASTPHSQRVTLLKFASLRKHKVPQLEQYSSRYYHTFEDDRLGGGAESRRPASPPTRDEARQWYRSIQHGGDVPYGGLRQPVPERHDSLFRVVELQGTNPLLLLPLRRNAATVDAACQASLRGVRKSAAVHDRRYYHGAGKTHGWRSAAVSASQRGRALTHKRVYEQYWREAFRPVSDSDSLTPSYSATPSTPTLYAVPPHQRKPISSSSSGSVMFSPVRRVPKDSGKYALERSRVSTFHLPAFRLKPSEHYWNDPTWAEYVWNHHLERRQCCPHFDDVWRLSRGKNPSAKSVANKATSTRVQNQKNFYDSLYARSFEERQKWDWLYDAAIDAMEDAIHDIDAFVPQHSLSHAWTKQKKDSQPQQTRTPTKRAIVLSKSYLRRRHSLPNLSEQGVEQALFTGKPGLRRRTALCSCEFRIRQFYVSKKHSQMKRKNFLIAPVALNLMYSSLPDISTMSPIRSLRKAISQEFIVSPDEASPYFVPVVTHVSQDKSVNTDFSDSSGGYYATPPYQFVACNCPVCIKRTWFMDYPQWLRYDFMLPGIGQQPEHRHTALGCRMLESPSDVPRKSHLRRSFSAPHLCGSTAVTWDPTVYGMPQKIIAPLDSPLYAVPKKYVAHSFAQSQQYEVPSLPEPPTASSFVPHETPPSLLTTELTPDTAAYASPAPPVPALPSDIAVNLRGYERRGAADSAYYSSDHVSRSGGFLEEERRKKLDKELEDQRARRHAYPPVTSKTPGVQLDRYDHVFEEIDRLVSATTPAPPPAVREEDKFAKALHNFSAQSSREVGFRKGEIIRIHRAVDANWYEAEVRGRAGIVPANYLEFVDPQHLKEATQKKEESGGGLEGRAKVLYNFAGRTINELPLKKGDTVYLTKKIDENWWEGRNATGRKGIFPMNYVTVLTEPTVDRTFAAAVSSTTNRKTPNRTIGDEHSKLMVNGVMVEPRSQTPKATGPTMGSRSVDALQVKSQELKFNVRKSLDAKGAAPFGDVDTYQAVYHYSPQHPDELELREGDVVYVVEKCDDGWYIGTSLRTGRFGTFPGNYVQLL